jgi:hypothetical protein
MGDLMESVQKFTGFVLILGGISIVVFVIASIIAEAKKKG